MSLILYQIQTPFVTAGILVDKNDKIVLAAPIVSRFIGKKFSELQAE